MTHRQPLLLACLMAALPLCAQGTAPDPIRNADQPMAAAKVAAISAFTLPDRYQDRAKYPLPSIHTNAKNPYFNPHDPAVAGMWREQGMSCGNAQAVGCLYNHEANRVRGFTTPAGAKDPEFSYQYTYHFLNDGNMMSGDAWMMVEAMDILKETGAMSTADFGGLEWGNAFLGWQSGYDKYHRAMKLRVDEYYKIDLAAPGSEELVKQILVDNADLSPHGGNLVLQVSFSNRITKTTIQGRPVYENFAAGGGHSLSIVGYDDTFLPERGGCWILHDVHANGLSYAPRDRFKVDGPLHWQGMGIPVLFLRMKPAYAPMLAFKVSLTHNQRGNIAVMAGVGGPQSTGPATWKDYAGAFNYSGALFPMGGRGQSATLEFGLDLTDFAPQLATPGQKLYLMVFSKGGAGQIDKVSLMDYTGGEPREIPAAETAKPIAPGSASGAVMTSIVIPFPGALSLARRHQGSEPVFGVEWSRGGSLRVRLTESAEIGSTLAIRDLQGRLLLSRPLHGIGVRLGFWTELPGASVVLNGKSGSGLYLATLEGVGGDRRRGSKAFPLVVSP